jgi:hypothetical protein
MTEPGPAIADPLLRRLYAYWLEKKGARIAPRRADILPEEILELLPWVFLVEIVGERLRFRLAGTAVSEEYGGKLTGMYFDEIDLDHVSAQVISHYHTAARDIVAVVNQWRYTKNDGRELEYERVILPLSSNGETVDMFLCAAIGRGIG